MKGLFYIILTTVLLAAKPVFSQKAGSSLDGITFYLVRHAEKDTGNDPVLKREGYKRAGDLYRVLKGNKLNCILVSQYRRSWLTADSLRIYMKTDTIMYMADATGEGVMEKLASLPFKPEVILIIGHSNTIPVLIRRLGVKDFNLSEIPITEYDNLYRVIVKKDKVRLKIMKYGDPSTVADQPGMKPLQ